MSTEIKDRTIVMDWSIENISRYIGLSFISMLLLAVFAEFMVRQNLIDWDDADRTYTNISESLPMFTSGVYVFILILIIDVFLAIAFYRIFRKFRETALLMSSLRLVYVAIKAVALSGMVLSIEIVSSGAGLEEVGKSTLELLMTQLRFHDYGFGIGLIFFGLHLGFLAVLIWQAGMPRFLFWLMMLAGIGYVLTSAIQLGAGLLSSIENIALIVFILPMTFAELAFGIWLMINGEKLQERGNF